jgi:TonB family protein
VALCAAVTGCATTSDQAFARYLEQQALAPSGEKLVPPLKFIHAEQPEFPRAAVLNRAEGEVVVEIVFDKTGAFKELRVISSPHPALTQAVAEAVNRWKIEPYVNSQGHLVEVTAKERFAFRFE